MAVQRCRDPIRRADPRPRYRAQPFQRDGIAIRTAWARIDLTQAESMHGLTSFELGKNIPRPSVLPSSSEPRRNRKLNQERPCYVRGLFATQGPTGQSVETTYLVVRFFMTLTPTWVCQSRDRRRCRFSWHLEHRPLHHCRVMMGRALPAPTSPMAWPHPLRHTPTRVAIGPQRSIRLAMESRNQLSNHRNFSGISIESAEGCRLTPLTAGQRTQRWPQSSSEYANCGAKARRFSSSAFTLKLVGPCGHISLSTSIGNHF